MFAFSVLLSSFFAANLYSSNENRFLIRVHAVVDSRSDYSAEFGSKVMSPIGQQPDILLNQMNQIKVRMNYVQLVERAFCGHPGVAPRFARFACVPSACTRTCDHSE